MAVTRQYKSWSTEETAKLEALLSEGKSHASIARKLNRTPGAVTQRIKRLSKTSTKKRTEVIKVNKQTLKSMELDVKGIKIHMVFS
jgi:IS30 family transposase